MVETLFGIHHVLCFGEDLAVTQTCTLWAASICVSAAASGGLKLGCNRGRADVKKEASECLCLWAILGQVMHASVLAPVP